MRTETYNSDARLIQTGLELMGLDMETSENLRSTKHVLLMPVGLQCRDVSDDNPGCMQWDRIEPQEVDPLDTRPCLWDFIQRAGAPTADIIRFTNRWGLLDYGEDATYGDISSNGERSLVDWWVAAYEVRAILVVLSASEAGELMPLDVLEELIIGARYDPFGPWELPKAKGHQSFDEFMRMRLHSIREYWQAERLAGRGLALQQRLATDLLYKWLNGPDYYPVDVLPIWDERGRRIETVARGVREIVGVHLGSIFAGPGLGFSTCSICGRPYSWELAGQLRRPRKGARHLCSDTCRRTAKREDSLASWHRNKARWMTNRRGAQGRTNTRQELR